MKLTVANSNISNNLSTARMTLVNASIVESLTLGNVSVTPSQISIGSVSITPTAVSVPTLVLGGTSFSGGLQGGIINYQEFTANGTWYNPYANASVNASLTGYEQVLVMAWGGGGGGGNTTANSGSGGGGGGACVIVNKLANECNSVCNVVVGVGGAVSVAGGNSVFWSNSSFSITSYGGGGSGNGVAGCAGGGGWFSKGFNSAASTATGANGGGPLGGDQTTRTSTFGGGAGSNTSSGSVAGSSVYGGGGAGRSNTEAGGNSIYGGGGGATQAALGTSIFGGNGGNTTVNASAPGGGGSANAAGARGEVRVWVFGPAGTTAGAPTYILTANTTTLYEGSSVLYTVTTTNVANNSTLYYTLNNSSTAVSSDFTTAVNGSVIISGGTGTFVLTANNDADSANEAFQVDVRTTSTTGSIVASNGSVSIIPDSGVQWASSYITDANQITYDYTNVPIGAPNLGNRYLVVSIVGYSGSIFNSRTISSATVNGLPATLVTGGSEAYPTGFACIELPSGTTANISITYNTTMSSAALGVWTAYDIANTTPKYNTQQGGSSGSSRSQTVAVTTKDITFARAGTTTDVDITLGSPLTTGNTTSLLGAIKTAFGSHLVNADESITYQTTISPSALNGFHVVVYPRK